MFMSTHENPQKNNMAKPKGNISSDMSNKEE
jgi:hypothetical protein